MFDLHCRTMRSIFFFCLHTPKLPLSSVNYIHWILFFLCHCRTVLSLLMNTWQMKTKIISYCCFHYCLLHHCRMVNWCRTFQFPMDALRYYCNWCLIMHFPYNQRTLLFVFLLDEVDLMTKNKFFSNNDRISILV